MWNGEMNMIGRRILLLAGLFVASCASPPKNPEVDGTNRQPVNDPQVLEALRNGTFGAANQDFPKREGESLAVPSFDPAKVIVRSVRRKHFEWMDTRLVLSDAERSAWLADAKVADWIQVLGRTDNDVVTRIDVDVAKGRAYAAHGFLVDNGVPAEKIMVGYSSAADYMADNRTAEGRTLNRRVEVIFYMRKE